MVASQREVALVDLVDRLLSGGVVLSGDITLSIADVDLVDLCLRLLITPAEELDLLPHAPSVGPPEPTRRPLVR